MTGKPKSTLIVGYLMADLIADTTVLMDPDFSKWPSHMQDQVYKAAEDYATAKGRSFEINGLRVSDDVGHPYVHILLRSPVYMHEAHLLASKPPVTVQLPGLQPPRKGIIVH